MFCVVAGFAYLHYPIVVAVAQIATLCSEYDRLLQHVATYQRAEADYKANMERRAAWERDQKNGIGHDSSTNRYSEAKQLGETNRKAEQKNADGEDDPVAALKALAAEQKEEQEEGQTQADKGTSLHDANGRETDDGNDVM